MTEFTKEQLVEYVKGCIEHAERFPGVEIADKEKVIFETALAALTAKPSVLYYPHTGTIISPGSFGYDVEPGGSVKLYTDAPAPQQKEKK